MSIEGFKNTRVDWTRKKLWCIAVSLPGGFWTREPRFDTEPLRTLESRGWARRAASARARHPGAPTIAAADQTEQPDQTTRPNSVPEQRTTDRTLTHFAGFAVQYQETVN
ncbi:MAG TPA: hypothetical protein VJS30_24035 [Paraburkholderia sp.]|nr:hypothetical protein [Paraburkholderia sp.]